MALLAAPVPWRSAGSMSGSDTGEAMTRYLDNTGLGYHRLWVRPVISIFNYVTQLFLHVVSYREVFQYAPIKRNFCLVLNPN